MTDTADTIRKIENLVLPDNVVLGSIDIVPMFTAVDQKDAYDTAMKKLARVYLELDMLPSQTAYPAGFETSTPD